MVPSGTIAISRESQFRITGVTSSVAPSPSMPPLVMGNLILVNVKVDQNFTVVTL